MRLDHFMAVAAWFLDSYQPGRLKRLSRKHEHPSAASAGRPSHSGPLLAGTETCWRLDLALPADAISMTKGSADHTLRESPMAYSVLTPAVITVIGDRAGESC
jgi:hypothetical protein